MLFATLFFSSGRKTGKTRSNGYYGLGLLWLEVIIFRSFSKILFGDCLFLLLSEMNSDTNGELESLARVS